MNANVIFMALMALAIVMVAKTMGASQPSEVGDGDERKGEVSAAAAAPGKEGGSGATDTIDKSFMFGAAFGVQLSYTWNFTKTGSHKVPFDVVDVSTPANLFNIYNSTFTPGTGQGGIWRLSTRALVHPNQGRTEMYLKKNGNITIAYVTMAKQNDLSTISADAVAYIAAQDTVEVQLYWGTFSGCRDCYFTTFTGTLVSRDWWPSTNN